MTMMTFTGWIEHIFDKDQYRHEFSVTDCDPDNPGNVKWPTTLKFTTSVKTGTSAFIEDLAPGDKVTVAYYLVGKSGTSKKTGNYYCMNELNVAKNSGVRILVKKPVQDMQDESIPQDNVDLPF